MFFLLFYGIIYLSKSKKIFMIDEINSQPPVSDFKLKASYWYVTHKVQLKKISIVSLVLLNVIFYSYIVFRSSVMFFIEQPNYLKMLNSLSTNLVDYSYFRTTNQPASLRIASFGALPNGVDGVDYVVNLENSNENWIVRQAEVQLIDNGKVVDKKQIFIYPGQAKYLVFFNEKQANQNSTSIALTNIKWQRTENFVEFSAPRLNFVISEIQFQPASLINKRGEAPVNTLNFKLANNSAYSYWQVGVYMILINGNGVVATNYLLVDQLKAGEIRDVSVNWAQSLPPVSTYLIEPEVDILNSSAYMPVE